MFRSTLLIYGVPGDVEAHAIRIRQWLRSRDFTASVRSGQVRASRLLKQKRSKSDIPLGTPFLAIDLCRIDESVRHVRSLEQRLPLALEACRKAEVIPSPENKMLLLDITATNATEMIFVRRLWFPATLLQNCAEHQVSLRIDVPPCGDE